MGEPAQIQVCKARSDSCENTCDCRRTSFYESTIEHSGSKREISTRSEPRVGGEIFFKKKIDVNIEKKKKNKKISKTYSRETETIKLAQCPPVCFISRCDTPLCNPAPRSLRNQTSYVQRIVQTRHTNATRERKLGTEKKYIYRTRGRGGERKKKKKNFDE